MLIRQMLHAVWRVTKAIVSYPVPQYTRAALYTQAVSIVVCLFFLRLCPLVPGIAIGLLGAIAALMAVRADRFTGGEKAVWILISVALIVVEFWAIYHDRSEHDKEQAAILLEEHTARRKEAEAFAALIKEGKGLIASQEQITNQMTGQGSYFYLMPTAAFPLQSNALWSNALPEFVGRYPLHDMFVDVEGPGGFRWSHDYGTMFPEELGRPREGAALTFKSNDPQPITFYISINASNGSFFEEIRFQKVDGQWRRALTVSNYKATKPVCTWMEIGFPNVNDEKLWPKKLWPTKTILRTDGNKRPCT